MDDIIYRQDALDALGEEPPVWYGGEDEIAERNQWRRDVKAIEGVPSAQPDIIRCKDCRFQDKGRNESESWNLCGYRPWLHVPTEDEHYCGYAERRTDDCV